MNKNKTKRHQVEHTSSSVVAEQIASLARLFPEAVAEGKVDFDKLRATLGDSVETRQERFSFSWAGKQDSITLLQTPSRATLVPCPDESVNFDATQHLFIEGDNLEVLKLLFKPYFGRVKLIYIDPPYNTGQDFIYPDDYADPLATYLKLTGQVDQEGNLLTSNPETSGRYHSSWLSMMYPRLFLARQLLTEEGIICISIDDIEVHHLRMMMNEVFGEENFIAEITWRNVYGGGAKAKYVVQQHEYILCYARNKDALPFIDLPPDPEARKRYTERDDKYEVRGPYYTQPLATTSMDDRPNLRFPIHWKGEEIWPEKQWQWSKDRVEKALANDELVIKNQSGKWSVRYKQYLKDEDGIERSAKPFSILVGPYTQAGTQEIEDLFGDNKVFPFPKPSELIQQLVSYVFKDENAIILDFFAGSCATAQAVLQMNRTLGGNRRFLMVQLPEPIPDGTPARKAGFTTIAEIGKERIRRVIAKLKKDQDGKLKLNADEPPEDLGFKVFKLAASNYVPWTGTEDRDPEKYIEQMTLFTDPLVAGWTPINVIWEVAVKEGYGLNSRIEQVKGCKENTVYQVMDPDKKQSFRICLDENLETEIAKTLGLGTEELFICRDRALNDTLAANLALQCRLKVI